MPNTPPTPPRPIHIVVGFDFSPLSQLSLREAAAVASQSGSAVLHIAHIIELHRLKVAHQRGQEIESDIAFEIEPAVEEALREAGAGDGVRVFTHVLPGHASTELLNLADEVEADLIVVGTHGRRAIGRVLVGSVADKVMRHASCPVLVMRPRRYQSLGGQVPEPPCPACVEARTKSGGAEWWCSAHQRPWVPPHRYSYKGGTLESFHADGTPFW